ncbi:MAG: RluA family pseudouridine synthase [Butyrivibrio sp.]|nr:RluA family pseudouridine synthase [Butyrivibrio sp.]
MKEIKIGNNAAGKRLDSFLKGYLPGASGGFIYKMLRKKNITLNGKKADGTEKLREDDLIKIFFSDETFAKFKGNSDAIKSEKNKETDLSKYGDVKVIYEDDNILLASKPVGLLSQKSSPKDISLNDWLIDYLLSTGSEAVKELDIYKPSICNRLDRNTGGIVICAKSLSGARVMNELLKSRNLDKYYRTIVSGNLSEKIYLKGFLYKDEKKNKVFIQKDDPKDDRYSYIETEIAPVKYNKDADLTMLEVKLVTGKPHQIRAHLSSIGHPLIGDVKYGGKIYKGVKHQLLFCYRVCFPDDLPAEFENITGREFKTKLPDVYDKFF